MSFDDTRLLRNCLYAAAAFFALAICITAFCACSSKRANKVLSTARIEYGQSDDALNGVGEKRSFEGEGSWVAVSIQPLAYLEPPTHVVIDWEPTLSRSVGAASEPVLHEQPPVVELGGDAPHLTPEVEAAKSGSAPRPGGSGAAPLTDPAQGGEQQPSGASGPEVGQSPAPLSWHATPEQKVLGILTAAFAGVVVGSLTPWRKLLAHAWSLVGWLLRRSKPKRARK